MAWGGLVVLWAQALGFALILLWGSVAGVVAVGFSVLGALFTSAIEAPIVLRVSRGGGLPADRSAALVLHRAGKTASPGCLPDGR
jgi:hypothetical protein